MVEKNAKEFKYMKFSTLRDLGTGFLGFLFCLSLSVVLILNFRPLYVYEMKSENLASVSSMTEEEILEEYDALIRYNSLFYRGELTFPSLPMSEEGRIHFEEVKGIFDGIQILLILSALTFLPLAVFRIWKKQFGFLRVIPGISAIVALLAFLVTFLDWDALFTAFHQLIFQNCQKAFHLSDKSGRLLLQIALPDSHLRKMDQLLQIIITVLTVRYDSFQFSVRKQIKTHFLNIFFSKLWQNVGNIIRKYAVR